MKVAPTPLTHRGQPFLGKRILGSIPVLRATAVSYTHLDVYKRQASAQKLALKTNALYLATTSPNLALEVRTSPHTTIEFGGWMSLWDFSDRTSFRHWMLQPELRYWLCESMNGSFFGLHAHGGQFNIGSIDIPVGRLTELNDNRYQGYFYGAGTVSYTHLDVYKRQPHSCVSRHICSVSTDRDGLHIGFHIFTLLVKHLSRWNILSQ